MISFSHIVIFDGTLAEVIPANELEYISSDIEKGEVEILKKFNDFDTAFEFCDKQNEKITFNGRY